jgi:VanZ family protein
MTSNSRRFFLYLLPVFLYAGLILLVSSIPQLPEPDLGIPSMDKLAHFVEYGILAILVLRAFTYSASTRTSTVKYLIAILICVIFAAFDEYHQASIPGRDSDLFDLAADSVGIVIGSLLHHLIMTRRANLTRPSSGP